MISLILADAEVERVPTTCSDGERQPRVCSVKETELKGIIVLDSYLHGHIIEGLEDAGRRGRPDIVHSFLLLAQGSKACKQGRLRVYIHTRADEVVFVWSRYQPEQNYISFLRSFGQLLEKGEVGKGEEGLKLVRDMDLRALIKALAPDRVIALTPSGDERDLIGALLPSQEEHLAVIIGGFPEGDYSSPVYEMADEKVSLGVKLLTVPDVTAQVLSSLPDYQPRS
jgi:rRNA small subunit pseudouridine methyltransferase Nep1